MLVVRFVYSFCIFILFLLYCLCVCLPSLSSSCVLVCVSLLVISCHILIVFCLVCFGLLPLSHSVISFSCPPTCCLFLHNSLCVYRESVFCRPVSCSASSCVLCGSSLVPSYLVPSFCLIWVFVFRSLKFSNTVLHPVFRVLHLGPNLPATWWHDFSFRSGFVKSDTDVGWEFNSVKF